jgi:Tetratricopeptide repeat.
MGATLNPDLLAKSYIALFYDTEEEYAGVIAGLSDCLRADPRNPAALNNRGVAYDEIGENELALADFSAAIQFAGLDVMPLRNRGMLRQGMGDLDAAVEDFSAAIRIAPTDPGPHLDRAAAHQELGHLLQALADLDEAIALGASGATAARDKVLKLIGSSDVAQR